MSINKDYFRRQAPLLRKMVRLTGNPVVADHLKEMARKYESEANDNPDQSLPPHGESDQGHGTEN